MSDDLKFILLVYLIGIGCGGLVTLLAVEGGCLS